MRFLRLAGLVACVVCLPAHSFAQLSALGSGEISGVVRDVSGAVLPGVWVEVASPAIIEKVRITITDDSGEYAIAGLRPGTYTMAFTLTGFVRLVRKDIVVAGAARLIEDASMRPGLTDTVTVSDTTPVVETRSVVRRQVFAESAINSLPISGSFYGLPVLIPGVNSSTRDVGGVSGNVFNTFVTTHGSRGDDQRVIVGGLGVGTPSGPSTSNFAPNPEATQEIVIETAASGAEVQAGGVVMNYVPKSGSDVFRGSAFVTVAGRRMQSRNFTQDLADQGATASPDTLDSAWEINPGVGGPIVRGRLWFYGSARRMVVRTRTNQFHNQYAFEPDNWAYLADPDRPARSKNGRWNDYQTRVTWQIGTKHTLAGSFSNQTKCECAAFVSPTRAPEAGANDRNPVQRTLQIEYRFPRSNRLLLEFVWQKRTIEQAFAPLTLETSGVGADAFRSYLQSVGVTVINGQGIVPNNFVFHGPGPSANQNPNVGGPFSYAERPSYAYHASAIYQAGSHLLHFGIQNTFGSVTGGTYSITEDATGQPLPVRYEFATPGIPRAVTVYAGTAAAPAVETNDLDHDMGLYFQDRLTMSRLTVRAGVRLDLFRSSYPEQTIPATLFGRPTATFAAGESLDWKDVTSRLGVSYDLRGDSRTALKFSLNKYVQSLGLSAFAVSGNPLAAGRGIVNNFRRNWKDDNHDFRVDCNPYEPFPNGECTNAIADNVLTAVPNPLTDGAVREGWGLRPYNWELSLGVQRELWTGVALDVSYFRRSFGNFLATDDIACVDAAARTGCRESANYRSFSVVTPVDSRLPGGGGYALDGFVDPDCSRPDARCAGATAAQIAALTPVNRLVMVSDIGARQIENWNGVDVSVSLRRRSLTFQGGTSTGRRYTNECEVWSVLPEVQGTGRSLAACEVTEPFRTSFKGLLSYTLPRPTGLPAWLGAIVEGVQVAGTVQSIPGNEMAATYDMTNAEFARPCSPPPAGASCSTLGHFLANQEQPTNTRNISLLVPGTVYDDRHTQLDLKIGKQLRVGATRVWVGVDVFNAFNARPVLTRNNTLVHLPAPGTYAAAQQQQADGNYNSLWVPTGILQPRFARFNIAFDF